MNISIFKKLVLVLALFITSNVWAATVYVEDNQWFVFDPTDVLDYSLLGLIEDDDTITFGAKVKAGDIFPVMVTAPTEFPLYAWVTTGPNFTGDVKIAPLTWDYSIPAGTSITFYIAGDFFSSEEEIWWTTVTAGGNPAAYAALAEMPGGELPLNFDPGTPSVPISAAGWLFGSGLLGLVGVARRKSLITSQ